MSTSERNKGSEAEKKDKKTHEERKGETNKKVESVSDVLHFSLYPPATEDFLPIKAVISSTASPPTKTPHGTVLLSTISLFLSLHQSCTV